VELTLRLAKQLDLIALANLTFLQSQCTHQRATGTGLCALSEIGLYHVAEHLYNLKHCNQYQSILMMIGQITCLQASNGLDQVIRKPLVLKFYQNSGHQVVPRVRVVIPPVLAAEADDGFS
jgi:hypothetical protein